MRLAGKVAVIAGAGANMSRATALLFAQEGARVYLLARGVESCTETMNYAKGRGGEVSFIRTDLTDDASTGTAFNLITREAGGIDIVSHHAGGYWSTTHDVVQQEPAFWDAAYAGIMRSLFLTVRHAVPAMTPRGGGAILTIAAAFRVRQMANSAYGSARDAQIGFVRNVSRELFAQNIRLHAICPGLIWSSPPSWESPIAPAPAELDRLGRPEDVAYAALYLASDEAAWLTGQVISVDGGDDVLARTNARGQAHGTA